MLLSFLLTSIYFSSFILFHLSLFNSLSTSHSSSYHLLFCLFSLIVSYSHTHTLFDTFLSFLLSPSPHTLHCSLITHSHSLFSLERYILFIYHRITSLYCPQQCSVCEDTATARHSQHVHRRPHRCALSTRCSPVLCTPAAASPHRARCT